ncbi:asparagine synthase-related protein [Sunxiuqinia sp. sy24]|uniref:asparagine synthase-related protein n=1 Tax=Sunxiuqinia sp. sy24 TaxID=3461495 RepID=UPI004045E21C
MSDFIFHRKRIRDEVLCNKLHEIYNDLPIEVKITHSQFGSLAYCKNIYNGFDEYETNDFICIVIGGPLLNFSNNNSISKKGGSDATKAIFKRWKIEKKMVWDDDLSGSFVVCFFNKQNGVVEVVTDMMSFIPVYSNMDSKNLVIGTHVDSLAKIQKSSIDKVSIADFVLHEIITYPFTVYNGIIQLPPATATTWSINEDDNSQNEYWKPLETEGKITNRKKDLSSALRKSIIEYVKNFEESKATMATFLSGGEDSRAILSAINQTYEKDSFVFIDELNRETSIAKKIAKKLNSNLIISKRNYTHYWEILKPACDLIGTCGDFAHVHAYNLQKKNKLENYDVILGGFFADALLKGFRIDKCKLPKALKFIPLPEKKCAKSNFNKTSNSGYIKPAILEVINERRKTHLNFIRRMRPKSHEEWFYIWPFSMNPSSPNLFGNRRLFRDFEPFTSSAVVKIAAKAPQVIKLNKRLFHNAFFPLFTHTKWIPHGNGSFPFFPWYINTPLMFCESVKRRIRKYTSRKKGRNEGSWSNWDELMKLDQSKELTNEYRIIIEKNFSPVFKNDFNFDIVNNTELSTTQRRIIIQLGYQLSKLEDIRK